MSPSPYFWSVLGYLVVLSVIAIRKSRAVRTEADFVLAGRGLTAPGCSTTRVIVTRAEFEFSGNSS